MGSPNKRSVILPLLAVGLLLAFFPILSYYYLNKGYQYQKALMADLKVQGDWHIQGIKLPEKEPLTKDMVQGKVWVSTFIQDTLVPAAKKEILQTVHNQFNKQEGVVFLIYLPSSLSGFSKDGLNRLKQDLDLEEPQQVFFISDTLGFNSESFSKQFYLPASANAGDYFILSDGMMQVRRYYNLNDKDDLQKLVEHTAMLMPRKSKDRPELVPQREK